MNEFHDSVIGTLKLSEDNFWEATVKIEDRTFGFSIVGVNEPDPRLLAHARQIVSSFDQFENAVLVFLKNEAQRKSGAADEIRQLTIQEIVLCWPKQPDDGMIYFHGPDKYRLWRCDYIGREPKSLTFDD